MRSLWPARLRFKLKHVFVLVTLVCVYFGYSIHRHQREAAALRAITAAGGTFAEQPAFPFYPFHETWAVSFSGREFDDEKLEAVAPHLADLPGLTRLQLFQTSVTNAGIPHLADAAQVRSLDLWDINITDDAVPEILKLTALKELNVGGTMISNAGAAKFKSMLQLEKLTLPHGPNATAPAGSLQAELLKFGDEILAQESLPGVVSQPVVDMLTAALPACTVKLDMTIFYSGPKRGEIFPIDRPVLRKK